MSALLQAYLPLFIFIAVAIVIGLALLVLERPIPQLAGPDVRNGVRARFPRRIRPAIGLGCAVSWALCPCAEEADR